MQTYDDGRNRTWGCRPWCLFHIGAIGRMAIFCVACIAVHGSYEILTHSIHFFFLSNVCPNLFVTNISKRCLSCHYTLFLSNWCIHLTCASTSWFPCSCCSSLVFPLISLLQAIHWSMPYCHIDFTRLDFHLACISVSPWCSLLMQ